MTRLVALVLAAAVLLAADTRDTRADEPYTPAPADKVPNYFAQPMPCKIARDVPHRWSRARASCSRPSRCASCRSCATPSTRATAGTAIASRGCATTSTRSRGSSPTRSSATSSSPTSTARTRTSSPCASSRSPTSSSARMRDDIFARYGKIWTDKPEWTLKNGKTVKRAAAQGRRAARLRRHRRGVPRLPLRQGQVVQARPEVHDEQDRRRRQDRARPAGARHGAVRARRRVARQDRGLARPHAHARGGCGSSRCATCASCATRSTRAAGAPSSRRSCATTSAAWSWYKPRPDYSDKLLSANDVRNIALIQLGGERVRRAAQRRGLADRAGHRRCLMSASRSG